MHRSEVQKVWTIASPRTWISPHERLLGNDDVIPQKRRYGKLGRSDGPKSEVAQNATLRELGETAVQTSLSALAIRHQSKNAPGFAVFVDPTRQTYQEVAFIAHRFLAGWSPFWCITNDAIRPFSSGTNSNSASTSTSCT